MRRFLPLLICVPWLAAAVPDRPPPPLAPTADEAAVLAEREVVVRIESGPETGGGATGLIDVGASRDRTWAAVMDLHARVPEIGGLKSVEIYLDEPNRRAARWTMKVLTVTVVFHILYELDPAAGWVRYGLDPDQPNDLVMVQGAYQLVPLDDDRTRLIFRSETDSGRRVPQWIKRWLATDSLAQQLEGIRDRAEAPP